jgi:hypothetical protein
VGWIGGRALRHGSGFEYVYLKGDDLETLNGVCIATYNKYYLLRTYPLVGSEWPALMNRDKDTWERVFDVPHLGPQPDNISH